MIIQKTYLFGHDYEDSPSFGITLRAGDNPDLTCNPHRVYNSIEKYHTIEMLAFKIDKSGKRTYTELVDAIKLHNRVLTDWYYITLPYDNKYGMNGCGQEAVNKVIQFLLNHPNIEQYDCDE